MADARPTEPDRLAPAADRRRRHLLLAVAVAAVAGTSVVTWLSIDRSGPETGQEAIADPALGDTVPAEPPPGRRYTDQELGIDELIDEEVTPFDARFRSSEESSEQLDEMFRRLEDEAVGHERERLHFENNLALVFWQADERDPPDREQLDRAYRSAMDECAQASGYEGVMLYEDPDIDPERYQNDGAGLLAEEQARLDSYKSEFGLDRESYLDLRHECAKHAASYPTLDSAVRNELVGRLREHYRRAVHAYLREFPDAEVPLVGHPSAPRPLEDRLISTCLKTPDPAQCAVEFRVELPDG